MRDAPQVVNNQSIFVILVKDEHRQYVIKSCAWMNNYKVTRFNQYNDSLTHFVTFSYCILWLSKKL